jgi:signal transduction histidine kinase
LLLGVTLIPIVALGWLSARVLSQDSALERQRRREQLEFTGSKVALAIERRLQGVEDGLARGGGLVFTANGIAVDSPGAAPLYQPVETASEEPVDAALAEVEVIEFSGGSLALAADGYRTLAGSSSDARRRAGALLRLGRVLRKQRDWNGAVEAYRRLLVQPVATVGDQPKELAARQGICRVYEETHNATALNREADALAHVLYSGELRVDRATFELYRDMVVGWGGPPPPEDRVAITEAATELWRSSRPPRGRKVVSTAASPVMAIWVRNSVWLGGPAALVEVLGPAWADEPVRLWLTDTSGRAFLGEAIASGIAVRSADFVVGVAWKNGNGDDGDSRRRTLLTTGLALMLVFTAAAAFGLYAATTRSMQLAQQQADFVSAVSHEFRTPITSMRHLTELLLTRGIRDEQRKHQYYELLANETERLHRMVETLLSFGRIEAGAYAWRLEPVDAGELLRNIIAEFTASPSATGRKIVCDISSDLPTIQADRDALSRAVWNLLENAAKYSGPDTPIRVFGKRSGDTIMLGVEDRGQGIAKAEQSRIFQKFVRSDEAQRSGIRGVGIGLALVKRITEAHGGSVQLSSEPGCGSTFTLVFPCHAS